MRTSPTANPATAPIPGPAWHVEAYKYDGTLHYSLPVQLVRDDGQMVWVQSRCGAELHHITRGWVRPMRHAADMFFWRDTWYNVYANYRPSGMLDRFYCNVSLPPAINDNTVSFVDIDLDVAIYPNGAVDVLDVDEFDRHRVIYRYPREVQHKAQRAVLDILMRWRARSQPFDRLP